VLKPDKKTLLKLLGNVATDLALLFAPLPRVKGAKPAKYGGLLLKLLSSAGAVGALLKHGLVNIEALEPLVARHLDMAKVIGSPVPVFITTYSLPSITRPLGRTGCYRLQDLDVQKAVKLVVASMSIPFLSPAVKVDGIPHRDGGMGEWLPVRPLLDGGYRNIIALSTKPGAKLDTLDHEEFDILTIGPEKALARFPMTLRFAPERVTEWMNQGYEDAGRALAGKNGLIRHPTR
jgi:predicted acylesterase/phospholipase RssA